MRRRRRQLEGVNLLELVPVRTAAWKEVEGRAVLERPRPYRRGLLGWLEHLSWLTGVPRLRLDEIGTFVWSRLDGATPVTEVCQALREAQGEACEPAEERVGHFLRTLHREEMVAYRGHDDERIHRFDERQAEDQAKDQAAGDSGPAAIAPDRDPPPGSVN